jgi:hypothetical protein
MSDRLALADAIGNASIERGARNATDTAMEQSHTRSPASCPPRRARESEAP